MLIKQILQFKFQFHIKETPCKTYRNRIKIGVGRVIICDPLVCNRIIDIKCVENLNT